MMTGNNYSGARWAFSQPRSRRRPRTRPYWTWVSPEGVGHAQPHDGPCYTCGKTHTAENGKAWQAGQ
jgi:hypothetical protein